MHSLNFCLVKNRCWKKDLDAFHLSGKGPGNRKVEREGEKVFTDERGTALGTWASIHLGFLLGNRVEQNFERIKGGEVYPPIPLSPWLRGLSLPAPPGCSVLNRLSEQGILRRRSRGKREVENGSISTGTTDLAAGNSEAGRGHLWAPTRASTCMWSTPLGSWPGGKAKSSLAAMMSCVWRGSEHTTPKYTPLAYWFFHREDTWETAAAGRTPFPPPSYLKAGHEISPEKSALPALRGENSLITRDGGRGCQPWNGPRQTDLLKWPSSPISFPCMFPSLCYNLWP